MRNRPIFSCRAFAPVVLMSGIALLAANSVSAQQITQMSAAADSTPATGGSSYEPVVSADGRFVAFSSSATNLVPDDTNDAQDIFVKDRVSGAIERVSVRTTGEQATAGSRNPRISADGRFVAFDTAAPLVDGDLEADATVCVQTACVDVYLHDRQTDTTTRLTVSSNTTPAGSSVLGLSTDGRFVLFSSSVPNLVNNDTNNFADLFVLDRLSATTTRVSLDLAGGQLLDNTATGVMSADGRVIVYPAPSDPPGTPNAGSLLYLYERETGNVSDLSSAFPARNLPASLVPVHGDRPTFRLVTHISDDGRVVAAEERIPGLEAFPQPFLPIQRSLLHDRVTGHTVASTWQAAIGVFDGRIVSLSGDGRTYAIASESSSVIELVDRVGGLREVVPTANGVNAQLMSLSADGRYAAFSPFIDQNTPTRVYAYDRDSGDGDGMPSAWETLFGLDPTNLTDAAADADLDGVTNLQEFLRGTHPNALASATRYFAEGASNAFFTTRLAAVNPGDDPAVVVFRFLGSNGQTTAAMRTIGARSRITVDLPENSLTPGNDFSTVVESDRIVVVDRTMTWDGSGYGAHTETALTAPATTWHLAEGATHGAFSLFYLLQNPNDGQAHVTITYLRQAPFTPVVRTYQVEPNSRKTIPVDDEGPDLDAVDTAATITSDLPIVAERAMYSTRAGQPPFAAGHGAAGVTAPALRWFLAEGATGTFFDLYVLVGNPNTTASQLKVTYLLPSGAPFEKEYSVGPQQRLTIYPEQEDARLANTPVSVIVESINNQPVVVERAMWWPKGEWYEAHVSAGATTTGTRWALADGEVSVGGDTYILIANTSTTAGTATVTLLEEAGTPLTVVVDLPASSRVNVPVSTYLPPTTADAPPRRFGALIDSNGVEIVVERSIYTTTGGITWSAGTAALGTKLQ